MNKLRESYVVFCNSILKQNFQSMEFQKLYEIDFESQSDANILAQKFSSKLKEVLVTQKEFEHQFLSKYDTIQLLLPAISENSKTEIATFSIKFVVMTLKHMKIKLPFNNEFINQCQTIFFDTFNKSSWIQLKNRFANILKTEEMKENFINELDNLQFNYKKITQNSMISHPTPLRLWKSLQSFYPHLYLLAQALLVLPHSSVPVEKVFSKMRDITTIKRNRLTIENVEACLLNYQFFGSEQVCITSDMKCIYLEKYTIKKKVTEEEPQNEQDKQLIEGKQEASANKEEEESSSSEAYYLSQDDPMMRRPPQLEDNARKKFKTH